MLREQKPPSGPRPEYSPSKAYGDSFILTSPSTDLYARQENSDSGTRLRAGSFREPTLHASSHNNHSLFSFGGYKGPDENTTVSYDFLPSPSFDDLQSSIASASNDLISRSSAVEGPGIGGKRLYRGHRGYNDGYTTEYSESRADRSSTSTGRLVILRRQSTSTRQSSTSSTASGVAGTMDPPYSTPCHANTASESISPLYLVFLLPMLRKLRGNL
jgi:dual specificity tyrosine-phosphorylation-regulated kinase 2/3/4